MKIQHLNHKELLLEDILPGKCFIEVSNWKKEQALINNTGIFLPKDKAVVWAKEQPTLIPKDFLSKFWLNTYED